MADTFTSDQISNYFEAFHLFDKDRNGHITIEELASVLYSLGLKPSNEELQDMINAVDKDGNGTVEFEEFVNLMARKVQITDAMEGLREAFDVFDIDRNGFLSADELRQAMKNLGETVSDEELEQMMTEADTDHDGFVNYEEFVKIIVATSN